MVTIRSAETTFFNFFYTNDTFNGVGNSVEGDDRFWCMRFIYPLVGLYILLFVNGLVSAREWRAQDHSVYYQDKLFRIKGINWFGYETDCAVVQGLWVRQIDELFQFLEDARYNAIRLPFSYEMVQNLDGPVKESCVASNTWMIGMSVRNSLHMFFQKSMQHHIAIVLDFHTIGGVITYGPSTDTVTREQVFGAWTTMIREYGRYPNLMAIDIKNEPHQISWKTWGSYVQDFVPRILNETGYDALIFVEGIQDHSVWGGSFETMGDSVQQCFRSYDTTLVFSPHVYGVSIRGSPANRDNGAVFTRWFGFLRESYTNPIVLGEIGGFFITDDYEWHMKIQHYLIAKDIHNVFYWCLNPTSIDTQGILYEDWWTVNEEKLEWHTTLQPDPTRVNFLSTP